MKDIRYVDPAMYLDKDFKIVKSSDYFDKTHGNARDMFYQSDLSKLEELQYADSVCVELTTCARGIVYVSRSATGYVIKPLGMTGELYQRLKNRQKIYPPYYDKKVPLDVLRASIHMAEVIRIINEISNNLIRPIFLSQAPILKYLNQELKRFNYRSMLEVDTRIQAKVSERDFNLLTAAVTSAVASFSYDRQISITLRSVVDFAAFSVVTEFQGSSEDRAMIENMDFDEKHADLMMIKMLSESLGFNMICAFEGLDDRYLRVGFTLPILADDPTEMFVFCDREPDFHIVNIVGCEFSILKAPD